MLPFYYAFVDTPLGKIRIKSTTSSIHEVVFTDEPGESDMHCPAVTQQCLQEIEQYFSGKLRAFSVPINPSGTTFQLHVWEQIAQVDYGNQSTYRQIALHAGGEDHIRAVGSAIGQNKLALIIPCHRITGSNGELRGFAWGLERKQWLLDFEARQTGQFMKLF